jgi:hypothetical protein
LFATGALLLTPRLRPLDRWALAGSGLLLLAYFAYWHDGFYLGPRFVLPLVPWLAWWSARLPGALRERALPANIHRAAVVTGATALVIAAAFLVPIRLTQYRNGMLSMRLDADAAAEAAGIREGMVLVRESWGAQLVARMWGLGVTRPDAERWYRSIDACELDGAIGEVERRGGGAPDLTTLLRPRLADSATLVAQYLSPDTTLRTRPGVTPTGRCARRLDEDRAGTSVLAPRLLSRRSGVRFVRDLHERDRLLWDAGIPELWLLTQAPEPGSPLRLERISHDSMFREWALP